MFSGWRKNKIKAKEQLDEAKTFAEQANRLAKIEKAATIPVAETNHDKVNTIQQQIRETSEIFQNQLKLKEEEAKLLEELDAKNDELEAHVKLFSRPRALSEPTCCCGLFKKKKKVILDNDLTQPLLKSV